MELNLNGRVAVVTGGAGAIGGTIASALAQEGVSVCIWDVSLENGSVIVEKIEDEGGIALLVKCDVTNPASVSEATAQTMRHFDSLDILVNGAGGSIKEATTSTELEFFDISSKSMSEGIGLNYFGTVQTCQSVGRVFAERGDGVILNISSIAGITPLSRAVTYSDAKAAVNSFTKWLAVHMAKTYSPKIRVNAVAPGFILTDQNRFLLLDPSSGGLTQRGETILQSVPMARLGEPQEIVGAALWLVSDRASFVTGTVIAVDGGFTAYCGV